MTPRKKPGVAFWTTVVMVVLLVGYPLSFGPACWIATRLDDFEWNRQLVFMTRIYYPLWSALRLCPNRVRSVTRRYIDLGLPDDVEMRYSYETVCWSFRSF